MPKRIACPGARRAALRDTAVLPAAECCEPRLLLAASLVADLNTFPQSSYPGSITAVGATAFFAATTPGTGTELWKSDGTPGGAVLVKDIVPGPADSRPSSLVDVQGTLFFIVRPEGGDARLWKSDGTPAGTLQVTDALSPGGLFSHGGAVYFPSRNTDGSEDLFRSDGTPAGTVRVKHFSHGPAGAPLGNFVSAGDKLFFTADDGVHGSELWETDGTEAGTALVADVTAGPAWTSFVSFAAAGGLLYFQQKDQTVYRHVWRTDGTSAGTYPVYRSDGGDVDLAAAGDKLFFTTFASQHDAVWVSDGTPRGTVALHDFGGDVLGRPFSPTALGDSLYFLVTRPGLYDLWKSDGTAGGTVRIQALPTPPEHAFPDGLRRAGNRLFFSAWDSQNGWSLWSTDGTPGGAARVGHAPGPAPYDVRDVTDVSGVAFFAAETPGAGRELWRSDGTPAGTYMVADIDPSNGSSSPHDLVDANGTLYFTTGSNDTASLIFKTSQDGNAIISASGPDTQGGLGPLAESLTPSSDLLYFTTHDIGPYSGPDLERTDGTPDGTEYVDAGQVFEIADLDMDGSVLLSTRASSTEPLGIELWRVNRASKSAVLVKDINPGQGGSGPSGLTRLNGDVFFAADDGQSGYELWKSDGTPGGTSRVKDILPGPAGSNPHAFARVGELLFFRVTAVGGTTELWETDGTEAGTRRVAAVKEPPYRWPDKAPGSALGATLIFAAVDPEAGEELWRSDGTEAGTYRLKDLNPGPDSSLPAWFATYGDRVYFTAYDPDAGRELWSTDGTAAGTARVADVWPGAAGASPEWLTASGGALWFAADSAAFGRELWKFVPDQPTVVARHVFYNNSAFDGRDPAPNAGDFDAVAWDKEALLPGPRPGATGPVSMTNFDKGINGLLFQIVGRGAGAPSLTADDLQFSVGHGGELTHWAPAPAPSAVAAVPGPGPAGSWFAVTWPDGAIRDNWLRVRVRANERTGLATRDEFYFGNLSGDADGDRRVNALDLAATRRALNTPAATTTDTDFNRDGRVNALDLATLRRNLNHTLGLLVPEPVAPALTAAATDLLREP